MPVSTYVSTTTDPRERGREFGRAHRDQVATTAQRYQVLFVRRAAARGVDIADWTARFATYIRERAPQAAAEIEGIAEGAGVDPLDVFAINARTELLAKADPYGMTECSSVTVHPPDGEGFGVQTWDWYAHMADGWLRWRFPLPDGGWVDTVTEYGLLAKIGLNDRGLGVLLNILHHRADDSDGLGLPVHLVSRRLLEECATVAEADDLVRRTPVAASTALTVLDPDRALGLELFPGGPGTIAPVDGVFVRTNHFLSAAGEPGCLTKTGYPSTHVRYQRLDGELRSGGEGRGEPPKPEKPDDVLVAMDHHDPLGGVCRHPLAGSTELTASETLATVVIRPGARELEVHAGGPRTHAR